MYEQPSTLHRALPSPEGHLDKKRGHFKDAPTPIISGTNLQAFYFVPGMAIHSPPPPPPLPLPRQKEISACLCPCLSQNLSKSNQYNSVQGYRRTCNLLVW